MFSSVDLYTNQSQSNKSYSLDNVNYFSKKKLKFAFFKNYEI